MKYKISIIIPLYNESETIYALLDELLSLPINCEIILVDDGSTDSSQQVIQSFKSPNIRLLHHLQRAGKGAAVQTGLQVATGDVVVIQDADLEYNPNDIVALVELIETGQTNAAYGVRDLSSQRKIIRLGNKFLTIMTNILYGHSIHDMTTCYKVMTRELMQSLDLESKGFAIDAEITAKVFKLGYSIAEHPIQYSPRYINKKLKIYDGFPMLWALLKYKFKNTLAASVITKSIADSA